MGKDARPRGLRTSLPPGPKVGPSGMGAGGLTGTAGGTPVIISSLPGDRRPNVALAGREL